MSKGSRPLSISPFLPKSFCNCLRWCVSGGLAIVILSFQEPFLAATAPGMQAAAQATEETVFPDNTASFETTYDEVRAVKDILINQVRAGYREFDLSLIEPLLARDFQRRTITSQDAILIETREDYLGANREWDKRSAGSGEVLYAIQSASVDQTRTRVNVLLVATYRSKYFNPRFLETFLFEKTNGGWMLKRQVVLPLHPNRPELYDVQIFVVKPCEVSEGKIQKLAITHGVDAFVDQCLKGSYDSLPYELGALILFVFREPPPVGSEIKTELIYERTYGDFPFDFTYKVKKSDPYFVIANEVYSEDLDGWFIMRVYVDGIKVGERKIGA